MPERCIVNTTDSIVRVHEGKRSASFKNQDRKEYQRIKIDNCVVREGIRADYLINERGNASALIELKGKNVEHAAVQLFTSVEHDEVRPLLEDRVGFLVICSRYPRFDSFVLKAKQKAARIYKAGFHVVCDRGEFDINKITAIKDS
jgi:hypothetical protein